MAKIVHEINGVLHSNLRHDLKTNIRDLRLPAVAGSLKTHPQDSFRFKYAKNTSSSNQDWLAQLVEHAGLVLRTGVRFPSLKLVSVGRNFTLFNPTELLFEKPQECSNDYFVILTNNLSAFGG